MRAVISDAAEQDLASIQSYIASDNPRRAASFVAELERLCMQMLAQRPHIGRPRDDISPGLRVHTHKGYLICYRVAAAELRVLRVFHASYDITQRF